MGECHVGGSGRERHLSGPQDWSLADRKIGADQLPAPSRALLPLDRDAEEKRAAGVEQQFGKVAPGIVQYTTDVLFRDLWLRPDLAPRDRSLGHCQRAICVRPSRTDSIPSQQGDGQRIYSGAGSRGYHAVGVLRGLAECVLSSADRKGSFRETRPVALWEIYIEGTHGNQTSWFTTFRQRVAGVVHWQRAG